MIVRYKPKPRGGNHKVYPWDKWLTEIKTITSIDKQQGFKLVKGKDFECQVMALVNNLRKMASRAGFRVNVFREEDAIVVFYAGPVSPTTPPRPRTRGGKKDVPLRSLPKARPTKPHRTHNSGVQGKNDSPASAGRSSNHEDNSRHRS